MQHAFTENSPQIHKNKKKQPEKGANAKKFEKFIKITLPISKSIKKAQKTGNSGQHTEYQTP